LERASAHVMTAEELFEQRVSFVFSCMKPQSGVTKDRVREMLREHYGMRPEYRRDPV
jgi:hypothetical protein